MNIRVHAFYYLKWRHLVNRLLLVKATLKLQHHGVGRHLVHRKEKRFVCGTRGQGQQSILVMRRFLAKDYCIRARCSGCGHYKWTLQQDGEAINMKMSFIEPNMTLWPPNNQDLNLVEYTFWGRTSEDGLPLQKFQVCARIKKCNSRCVAIIATSIPWPKYQRMASSPWKCSTV